MDPTRFRSLDALEAGFATMPGSPADLGALTAVVSRTELGHFANVEPVRLTPEHGVPGDAWVRKEGATLESQITVMRTGVAQLIANGRPLAVFGDNLFMDLDLSVENLPPGSRVTIGGSLLEVAAKDHKGCKKFSARFGLDALRFVSTPQGRRLRFRGLYLMVVEPGEIAPGDTVTVVERAPAIDEGAV
ncbi:MAG: MOSC domain-containing protein [Actinomycetota bacterium]